MQNPQYEIPIGMANYGTWIPLGTEGQLYIQFAHADKLHSE